MFNPLKYQFSATHLGEQGEHAVLKLRRGTTEESVLFPKRMLPPELTPGTCFIVSLQPEEASKQNEAEILKQLLSELVR